MKLISGLVILEYEDGIIEFKTVLKYGPSVVIQVLSVHKLFVEIPVENDGGGCHCRCH